MRKFKNYHENLSKILESLKFLVEFLQKTSSFHLELLKYQKKKKFASNLKILLNSITELKEKTVSLWSFINSSPTDQYKNPLYGGYQNGIQTVLVSTLNLFLYF